MQIDVGSVLTMKGRNYICICIEQFDQSELAKEDSETRKQWLFGSENVKWLAKEVDDFVAGDTIHITGERITLECPGIDLQFIWTKYKLANKSKETANERISGVESNLGQGPGAEVESIGSGDPGGKGDGETCAGQISGPIYGHGQGGEGGELVHPSDSEGEEHPVA